MPLFPTLGKQMQADLGDFEANLIYRASSWRARVITQKKPYLRKQNKM